MRGIFHRDEMIKEFLEEVILCDREGLLNFQQIAIEAADKNEHLSDDDANTKMNIIFQLVAIIDLVGNIRYPDKWQSFTQITDNISSLRDVRVPVISN